jgi:hypothetical protein
MTAGTTEVSMPRVVVVVATVEEGVTVVEAGAVVPGGAEVASEVGAEVTWGPVVDVVPTA